MKFTLKFQGNIYNLMRHCSYRPHETGEEQTGELSFVRCLSSADYPRFHAYVSRGTPRLRSGQAIEINLHLDQKKPSYKGTAAHSGEYKGELVEKEAERIKKIAGT